MLRVKSGSSLSSFFVPKVKQVVGLFRLKVLLLKFQITRPRSQSLILIGNRVPLKNEKQKKPFGHKNFFNKNSYWHSWGSQRFRFETFLIFAYRFLKNPNCFQIPFLGEIKVTVYFCEDIQPWWNSISNVGYSFKSFHKKLISNLSRKCSHYKHSTFLKI